MQRVRGLKHIRSEIVSFRLTVGQLAAVRELAENDYLTESEIIRIALAEYLARRMVDIHGHKADAQGPWARRVVG